MPKELKWKIFLVLILILLSFIFLIPTLSPSLPPWWEDILPSRKINLGLDLQGGMHLVLGVQTKKAIETELNGIKEDIKEYLKGKKIIAEYNVDLVKEELLLFFKDSDTLDKARKIIEKNYSNLESRSQGMDLGLHLNRGYEADVKEKALHQALETIRNRVDEFGVAEPSIAARGRDRIVVQLPGLVSAETGKRLISTAAVLEFKLVIDQAAKGEDLLAKYNQKLPEGTKIYAYKDEIGEVKEVLLLKEIADITGTYLTDARLGFDENNMPAVNFRFNPQGAKKFGKITRENIGRRLAIVLDNVVRSAPVIQSQITDRGQITGSFTDEEAKSLAVILRAGALPVPVRIEEERTVGPSLGRDSIRLGKISMIVGSLLVVFFMGFYYKFSGLIANICVVLNILFILSLLAAFRATLTFPGIAGIILTVGMAVDGNVIIFERIREELRLGKTPKAAVEAGYTKAFSAIRDANITTLIAGIVLFHYGTGPIKGFAVTLSIGIVTTVFTSVFVSRVIYDFVLAKRWMKRLSI